MDDEIEIKRVPFMEPKLGTDIYTWGTCSTYKLTKAEIGEMFGLVSPPDKSETEK